jgi:hypothetical protein
MKSVKGKERWRSFIMPVSGQDGDKQIIPQPVAGLMLMSNSTRRSSQTTTLVRKDAHKLYDEDNAILVTRVQFFAIEVSPSQRDLGLGMIR